MNGLALFPVKILLGFVALSILLLPFGGPMAAAFLILLAVVCTAGIGLIVVIPLLYGLGSVMLMIIEIFIKPKNQTSALPKAVPITNDQKAIIDYIIMARNRSFKDEDIFTNLKINGWSEEAIHECFGRVESKSY